MTDQAKKWNSLLGRLKTCAYRECRGHGLAIISIKLMLRDGELIGWTRPTPTYTEPEGRGGVEMEREFLTDKAVEALASP